MFLDPETRTLVHPPITLRKIIPTPMSFAPLSRSRMGLHKTRVRSRQRPVEYGDSSQARMIAMTQA